MSAPSLDFESIKQTNVYGIEYWSAHDLMPLLGYARSWQNFEYAIQKAMAACQESGQIVENHFNASIKMVRVGSGAEREVKGSNLNGNLSLLCPTSSVCRGSWRQKKLEVLSTSERRT